MAQEFRPRRSRRRVQEAEGCGVTTHAQTARHKKVFLEHFRNCGNITAAAQATGCVRRAIYRWQEDDDAFVAEFRDAELQATDGLEAEAWRRAMGGSDLLLIFLLKARAPEKYRERYDVNNNHSGTYIQGETIKAYGPNMRIDLV
jgi:hypothetical protein